MGGIFNDRQIVLTKNKVYSDFYTLGWMSMIVEVTSVGGRDKK